jgi:hypothetical protein
MISFLFLAIVRSLMAIDILAKLFPDGIGLSVLFDRISFVSEKDVCIHPADIMVILAHLIMYGELSACMLSNCRHFLHKYPKSSVFWP